MLRGPSQRPHPIAAQFGAAVGLVVALTFGAMGSTPVFAQKAEQGSARPNFMVAAAHPLATEAGVDILKAGGSAIDAAIAVQMMLTLVEPQSSGIGGGAFLLHWDAKSKTLTTYDGRETAPAYITPTIFVKADGTGMSYTEARVGGQSVGVPGIIALLHKAHENHGNLVWSSLFNKVVETARDGFKVTPRLNKLLSSPNQATLLQIGESRSYFFTDDGAPLKVGSVLKNPALADTLIKLAVGGRPAFYDGEITKGVIDAVNTSPERAGKMSLADFKEYDAKIRPNLCRPYREWNVCSMGPPSSGGVTLLQILKLIEPFDVGRLEPGSAKAVHLIAEASRLAFADRNRYLADSDFVAVPVEGLLDTDYLTERRALIDLNNAGDHAEPGVPPVREGMLRPDQFGRDSTDEVPSTSHFVIIDAQGNAVSITTTIEGAFGSNLMAGGFMLNNQLRDFAKIPVVEGRKVANAPEPGKRPRSSMSPAMVFDKDGNLKLIIGSPGGSSIIGYVAKAVIGVLDWDLSVQDAINLPNFANKNGATLLETDGFSPKVISQLEEMGHKITQRTMTSGLHGILMTDEGYKGAADKRREGVAIGG